MLLLGPRNIFEIQRIIHVVDTWMILCFYMYIFFYLTILLYFQSRIIDRTDKKEIGESIMYNSLESGSDWSLVWCFTHYRQYFSHIRRQPLCSHSNWYILGPAPVYNVYHILIIQYINFSPSAIALFVSFLINLFVVTVFAVAAFKDPSFADTASLMTAVSQTFIVSPTYWRIQRGGGGYGSSDSCCEFSK